MQQTKKLLEAKKTDFVSVYLCGVCTVLCAESVDLESEEDNSIGCDVCRMWFHWGCVGFELQFETDAWICPACTASA